MTYMFGEYEKSILNNYRSDKELKMCFSDKSDNYLSELINDIKNKKYENNNIYD